VYAVGGNAEAARRAGINVAFIRVAVFTISGAMAAVGGIVAASFLQSVDLTAGSGTILLDAIAAAVIGGTSLFGGRGFVKAAPLGGLEAAESVGVPRPVGPSYPGSCPAVKFEPSITSCKLGPFGLVQEDAGKTLSPAEG